MTANDEEKPKVNYRLLLPQALVGLVDSVSYMIVAPSVVFYVMQQGGTYEQYGIILAAFSFASFLTKPVLGYWSDKSGMKFRAPYLTTIVIAGMGGLCYFLASAFPSGKVSIALILLGRILGGIGAANNTLGFSYIALVVPPDSLTQASAMLSMVRVIGMTASPGANVILKYVDTEFTLGGHSFKVDELNSVGLVMMIGNIFSFLAIYFTLEEPADELKPKKGQDDVDELSWQFWGNVLRMEILVPFLSIMTMNANFMLVETGLAPATNDALGWDTVRISTLFAVNSCFMLFVIALVMRLSAKGVSDVSLMTFGCIDSILGYGLIYFMWKRDTGPLHFILPFFICVVAFPFLGSPTRSAFTRAVSNNEYLCDHQGTMQAIMSMMNSIGGFVAPGLIAAYVLRTPDEVEASKDQREFTAWALFAPTLSLLTLIGVILVQFEFKKQEKVERETMANLKIDERLLLLDPEGNKQHQQGIFHPRTEANRRASVTVMGVPQIALERERQSELIRHSTAF